MLLIEHYFKKQNAKFAPQKRTLKALLVKNYVIFYSIHFFSFIRTHSIRTVRLRFASIGRGNSRTGKVFPEGSRFLMKRFLIKKEFSVLPYIETMVLFPPKTDPKASKVNVVYHLKILFSQTDPKTLRGKTVSYTHSKQ